MLNLFIICLNNKWYHIPKSTRADDAMTSICTKRRADEKRLLDGDVGLVKQPLPAAVGREGPDDAARPLPGLEDHDDALLVDGHEPVVRALLDAGVGGGEGELAGRVLADEAGGVEDSRELVSARDVLLAVVAGDSLGDADAGLHAGVVVSAGHGDEVVLEVVAVGVVLEGAADEGALSELVAAVFLEDGVELAVVWRNAAK